MTTDDTPIPGFDRIARAARDGLGQLARSDASGDLSWDAVQSGARHVQRRRLSVLGAACAIVLLSGGVAVAKAGSGDGGNLHVSEPSASTSTTNAPTTSVPDSTPTTTKGSGVTLSTPATTTTIPTPSGASAIEGTVTIASSTWVAEQPASFTLTVRNTAAQEFRFGNEMTLGIVVQSVGSGGCIGVDKADLVLAAGEQRSYTSELTPRPDMIGPANITAAVLYAGDNYSNCLSTDGLAGVPTVPLTIIPPGWVEGQPLDPSQGMWSATLSADSTTLRAGESTAIHVGLRNAGGDPQRTDGYGSLAVVCYGLGIEDGYPVFIGSTTLEPGAAESFTVAFPVDEIGGPGAFVCSVGMAFHGVPNSGSVLHIDSDYLGFEVLSASGSTTTSIPEPTTVPTTP